MDINLFEERSRQEGESSGPKERKEVSMALGRAARQCSGKLCVFVQMASLLLTSPSYNYQKRNLS